MTPGIFTRDAEQQALYSDLYFQAVEELDRDLTPYEHAVLHHRVMIEIAVRRDTAALSTGSAS